MYLQGLLYFSQMIEAAGGMHIECPMSGSVKPAEEGKLTFLASGSEQLLELAKPLLAVMGSKIIFLAEVRQGADHLVRCSMIPINVLLGCI